MVLFPLAIPACAFVASVSTRGGEVSGICGGRLLPRPNNVFDRRHSLCPPCRHQHQQSFRRALSLRESDSTEGDSEHFRFNNEKRTNLATDETDSSAEPKKVGEDNGAADENFSDLQRVLELLLSLKQQLYSEIRRVFAALVTIITRSTQKAEAWIRDDAVGQLLSSALGLVLFFAGVAAFAAWNIEVLGGKKWAGPAEVTVPVVRLPDASATAAGGGIRIQKAQWKAPVIRASYRETASENSH